MRNVTGVAILLLMLALSTAVAGCQKAKTGGGVPPDDYRAVALAEAPATLKAYYERMKAVPGLVTFQQDGETYVLLMAGKVEEAGLAVEVVDVRRPPSGSGQPVRLMARLAESAAAGGRYPYALLALVGAENERFVARLATRGETVEELQGLPLEER